VLHQILYYWDTEIKHANGLSTDGKLQLQNVNRRAHLEKPMRRPKNNIKMDVINYRV
jgi:hypothetical protein